MPTKEYELPDVWNVPGSIEAQPTEHFSLTHTLRAVLHKPEPVTILDLIQKGRQKVDAVAFAKAYRDSIHFQELDEDLVVTNDPIGLTRVLPNGHVETYSEKLIEDRSKGTNESASYGRGTIVGRRIASFISNWSFMGASSGAVYGEKVKRTTELAIKDDSPVFLEITSGGQRQQEAAGGLKEMDRSGHFIRKFKELIRKPVTSILVGDVWGGVTGSIVTEGDFVIGMAGTNFGFAGPGVIEGFTKERPPQGVQTVEYSFLTNRTVHVVLNQPAELGEIQEGITAFAYGEATMHGKDLLTSKREARGLNFDTSGFSTPLQSKVDYNQGSRVDIPLVFGSIQPDTIYNQHLILRSDPRRPDTEYIIQNAFDGYVPLYTNWTNIRKDGIYQRSPAIIAALAYIDDPRLSKRLWAIVIGNQPNYLKLDDGSVMTEPASPTAWDYRFQLDMMKAAEHLGIPVISFTNTLGAKPTVDAEADGQYREISDCLAAKDKFLGLELGFIIGAEGSGGGLATTLDRDHVEILDDAQVFVAEPESATRIIVKEPTRDDVVRTTEQMKPNAAFLKEVGIVDEIIDTEGGAQNNPFGVALKIRDRIIINYLELGGLSIAKLLQRAESRLNNLRPISIGYLNPRPEKQSLVSRVLQRLGLMN